MKWFFFYKLKKFLASMYKEKLFKTSTQFFMLSELHLSYNIYIVFMHYWLRNFISNTLLSKDQRFCLICFVWYNTNFGMLVIFTGAEIRSVCTEAGMFAIRARRKMATEKDFLEAVNKVIKAYAKFSSTPRYMTYN